MAWLVVAVACAVSFVLGRALRRSEAASELISRAVIETGSWTQALADDLEKKTSKEGLLDHPAVRRLLAPDETT